MRKITEPLGVPPVLRTLRCATETRECLLSLLSLPQLFFWIFFRPGARDGVYGIRVAFVLGGEAHAPRSLLCQY